MAFQPSRNVSSSNLQRVMSSPHFSHADKPKRSRLLNRYILVCIAVVFYLWFNFQASARLRASMATPLPHSAALCAVQKGALRYIDEWVDYNLAIGFDKLYIYDNSDDFETEEWYYSNTIIPNLQDRVEIQHFPGVKIQIEAYSACIERLQRERKHSWIAFLDLDEFLVIRDTKKYPYVMDLLDDLPDHVGGLAMNWVMFQMNNQTHYEPKPVTLRFQHRKEKATNRHVKTIARTEHLWKAHPHHAWYKLFSGVRSVDTSGHTVWGPFNDRMTDDVVAVYHFHTKSLEEYKERCKRGKVNQPQRKWKDEPSCKSDSFILNKINNDDQTVSDPAAWEILKERVPRYAQYET
eukprot:scaffold2032_cov122-Cylindrotheca_fusiformis.AAC.3